MKAIHLLHGKTDTLNLQKTNVYSDKIQLACVSVRKTTETSQLITH